MKQSHFFLATMRSWASRRKRRAVQSPQRRGVRLSLEELEERNTPSPVTLSQFTMAYTQSVQTLQQVQLSLLTAAPPPLQPEVASLEQGLNNYVASIPQAVLPLFVANGGVVDSQTLNAVLDSLLLQAPAQF